MPEASGKTEPPTQGVSLHPTAFISVPFLSYCPCCSLLSLCWASSFPILLHSLPLLPPFLVLLSTHIALCPVFLSLPPFQFLFPTSLYNQLSSLFCSHCPLLHPFCCCQHSDNLGRPKYFGQAQLTGGQWIQDFTVTHHSKAVSISLEWLFARCSGKEPEKPWCACRTQHI